MMKYQYPTAFSRWGEEEGEAVKRVILSQRWTQGPEVEAFEAELAQYHGRRHAIFVNSGSSANLIAVAALFHLKERPLKAGDKVIVPALAWSTTYAPLIQYRLNLIIADADATWNAPRYVRPTLYARLVVGCSILGNPAYLGALEAQARTLVDAYFLNDDCESLGAKTIPNQRTTGSYGLMATESFFYSHQLSAIEGGAVLTDDDECARLCRLLRNHGNAGFLDPAADFARSYDFQLMGYNVRGLELHAAIARAQLPKLEGFRRAREQNLNNFEVWAMGLPLALQKPNGIRSPFGIAFTVSTKDVRQRLVSALRQASIDCRLPTGGSFTKHPYGAQWREAYPTPVADDIHDRGLFLGNAPYPLDEEIQRAVKVMREVLV